MNKRDIDVREFIRAFDQDMDKPMNADNVRLLDLRGNLLTEEYREVMQALDDCMVDIMQNGAATAASQAHLLKELCDLEYVLSGFCAAFGLPFQAGFDRVHRSNMSKLGPDGKPVYREDGKVLKGPNYKPADLIDLVS